MPFVSNLVPANQTVLKELTDFQSTLLDEAGTYTKIIMGLGYGGFFAGWSGSKAYLPPKLLLASALLMTISLVLYILFEICQTTILSYLSIEFANATNKADADPMKALAAFKKRASRLTSRLLTAWKFVFPLTS